MQMRTSKPEAGNKFYNTTSKGGWSQCIQGTPTDSGCNVLSNCVGYACGRFNEIIGSMKYPSLNCNAENFIERAKSAGLTISNKPTLGGIMVWQQGATASGNDGVGHVAVVERIDNDNQIYTSESSWAGAAFFNATRYNSNGRWGMGGDYSFRGCIVNPNVKESAPIPLKTNEEIAAEVWAGKWGVGNDRKNRLTAAGYDYNAIQKLVDAGVGKPTPETTPKNEEVPSAPQSIIPDTDNSAEEHTRTEDSSKNKNQEADASDGKAEPSKIDDGFIESNKNGVESLIAESSEFFNFSPKVKLVAYLIGDAFLAAAALTPTIINCILATDLTSFGTALTATLTQAGVLILMIFKLVKKGTK